MQIVGSPLLDSEIKLCPHTPRLPQATSVSPSILSLRQNAWTRDYPDYLLDSKMHVGQTGITRCGINKLIHV